jgi:hypothetical protein
MQVMAREKPGADLEALACQALLVESAANVDMQRNKLQTAFKQREFTHFAPKWFDPYHTIST